MHMRRFLNPTVSDRLLTPELIPPQRLLPQTLPPVITPAVVKSCHQLTSGKTKDGQGQDRHDLNSGRLRLWFGYIHFHLLPAFAAVKQQSGCFSTGQDPCQEEATIGTDNPSLICANYTTLCFIFQYLIAAPFISFPVNKHYPKSENLYYRVVSGS
jgi:hypothetical protein